KIKEIARSNRPTIVCLIAGSPIAMDEWIDDVEAVLMCWYGGMEAGHAIANVLFGDVTPSGKLPLTFPKRLEDSPAHSTGNPRNYPGDEDKRVYYDEGIYIGYRWFDDKKIEPLFPFGFGLSYTEFEYDNIRLNRSSITGPNAAVIVNVDVTNTGQREGSEIVQVYSKDVESSIDRPLQELVGFEKVVLQPGESTKAAITVRAEDLAFYDVSGHDWKIEPGEFKLLVGKSSRNIVRETGFSYS
ncbi:MAG: glycoside hydrolase family 3 C-terminal domain-containing protein, partial [Candidatus Thorarchaeota archaeon]